MNESQKMLYQFCSGFVFTACLLVRAHFQVMRQRTSNCPDFEVVVFVLKLFRTPLHMACEVGNSNMVKLLLQCAADPEVADKVCLVRESLQSIL